MSSSGGVDKWKRMRNALFSKDRSTLFSNMPELELQLFKKDLLSGNEKEKQVILYKDIHENIIKSFGSGSNSILCNFKGVKITKPLLIDNDKCGEKDQEQVDATGLLRLYPSEEVLCMYMLHNWQRFENKTILELGSGFCGLCGLIFAKNVKNCKLTLSDGNETVLKLLREHCHENQVFDPQNNNVTVEYLLWSRHNKYEGFKKHDFIIVSDCLYLNRIHPDLLNCIYYLLEDEGVCIIVSPRRFNSMEFFLKSAEKGFHVYQSEKEISCFIDLVRDSSTEKFKPFYIELRKRKDCTVDLPFLAY